MQRKTKVTEHIPDRVSVDTFRFSRKYFLKRKIRQWPISKTKTVVQNRELNHSMFPGLVMNTIYI